MKLFREKLLGEDRWVIALVVGFIMLWIATLYLNLSSNINKKNLVMAAGLEAFQSEIDVTLENYKLFSNYIFEETINKRDVLENLDKAYGSGDKERDVLRKELLDSLQNDYERIVKHNFRQLHFQFPNGDSYLRFHSPEKFGDNLMSVRETIRIANEEKKYAFGFEEGKIYNGYRFVYPLSLDGRHVGSVEVSISMGTLIEVLHSLNKSNDVFMAIDSSIVESTVFEDMQQNYMDSFFSDDYVFDREMYEKLGLKSIGDKYSESFIRTLKMKSAAGLARKESFAFDMDYNGKPYVIKFLKLRNISGKPVGYFLSIEENEGFRAIYSRIYWDLTLISAVFALIFISVFIYMLERDKMRLLSFHDSLTGIFNRRWFMDEAIREIERYKRYGGALSVIIMDIDHFKTVNDTYGHSTGDIVLKDFSGIVQESLRGQDVFARWGGEEFIVMMPETGIDGARAAAEKIRSVVEGHNFPVAEGITISLGVSELWAGEDDIDPAVNRADDALYRAKRAGRNRVAD